MNLFMRYLRFSSFFLLMALACACSHKFDSNVLDLSFYQWNLWQDVDATMDKGATLDSGAPSCGWEEMHRGTGKLVRIPALAQEHFPGERGAEVYWYHCRFTLPEDWGEREVTLNFEGVGPVSEVFLNRDHLGSHRGEEGEVEMDVTDVIYYTRDNHLTVRIVSSDEGKGGIGGTITLSSQIPVGEAFGNTP